MARNIWEIKIDEETPQADLELCAKADNRTSDTNIQRVAAQARAELTRREQQFQIDMFNAKSRERTNSQKFQAAQMEREEAAMQNDSAVSSKNVMVVYGRDEALRSSMFEFLRSLSLNPIEWEQAVKATGSGSPHTLDVVIKAFEIAQSVVVLMSGDDLVRLRPELAMNGDQHENEVLPQPRPNVLFEAGMAIALHRKRTVPVSIGKLRRISDIDGINFVQLDNSTESRNKLATRLETAGCLVDRNGQDWLNAGNFEPTLQSDKSFHGDANSEVASKFSNEELQILTALFENGDLSEVSLGERTGLGLSKVQFWIGELRSKGVILQTRAGNSHGTNEFSIRPGQVELLRQIGVIS